MPFRHDLREPIRMIVSYTQLLDRRYQGQLEGDGADFMRYILEATQRMDRLSGRFAHIFPSVPLLRPAAGSRGA